MKNNIDEDIKIVENYLKESAINKQDDDFFKNVDWEMIDLGITRAISNVLSKLKEGNKIRADLYLDNVSKKFEIENLKLELQTHKKIAEYFAVKLYDLANEKMKEEYTTAQACHEYATLRDMCVRDMIISARNEVENGT